MTNVSDWEVILVDDEPDSLHLIHEILALYGAKVYHAISGAQFLNELRHLTPTLFILDLAMPRPDGWDLLEAIRENPATRYSPVVAITAYYSDKVASQAYDAGFDAFFPKPIKAAEFLAKLKELIS